MTLDGFGSGTETELASAGARLPGTRAGDGGYRLTSRRRRSDAHRIVASTLAVLALVGCVMAILILAVEPAATRMQNDIASLTERLGATESQLGALQKMTARAARQGSQLTRSIGLLNHHMTGLGRTIHGLQGSSNATRVETDGLRACFGALQQELGGLTLRTRSVHGHVTNVGLSETVGAPSACGAVFSG
jgi:septal ring factor EnvC (AmiA/AmiB activator)